MSDSESDPFAAAKGVIFRDGRVDVRMGRKVKTVRPKLSLADQYDLLAMPFLVNGLLHFLMQLFILFDQLCQFLFFLLNFAQVLLGAVQ